MKVRFDTDDVEVHLAGAGAGKAGWVDAVIPTPDGPRRFGDIKTGDYVFSAEGTPTKVTGVYPRGMMSAYRVTLSDGRSSICARDHLWGVLTASHGNSMHYSVRSLDEMLRKGIRKHDGRPGRSKGNVRWYIPASPVCNYKHNMELPVDPYVLGVFLGNGALTCKVLTLSSADEECVKRVAERLGVSYKKNSEHNYNWSFSRDGHQVRTADVFDARFRVLSGDKYIPDEYLYAGGKQRMELLNGLFDTDGCATVNDGRLRVSYSTTSRRLAENVRELLLSFGVVSTILSDVREGKNTCYNMHVNCGNYFKRCLFTLERKMAVVEGHDREPKHRYDRVAVRSVEKLPEKLEMQCIVVEHPLHLYLCEDYIVTHNSFAAMQEMQESLKVYRPDEIAFVTYTKKGVENGIARALKVNPQLTPDDLMHFKTLHALCFREAHLTGNNIMTGRDIAAFNEAFGFNLSMSEVFGNATEDDRLLQRYDAERSGSRRGVFVDGNFDRMRYDRLVNAYESFKQAHGLVDFHDCLLRYMTDGEPLHGVKVCLIDECQDLTPLQWEVCMKAFSCAEKVRCYGDDFQCQPAGTKVLTKDGYVPIEECQGKRLLTYDMNEGVYKMSDPVTLAVRETDEPLYEVRMQLPGGTVFNYGSGVSWFTGNHKLIVRDKNRWNIRTRTVKECLGKTSGLLVPWFNLERGVLSSILPDWVPFDVSISRTSPEALYKVYSLNVPEFHTYIADSGLTVHNCLYTYNGAAPELLIEMASHYRLVRHETSYRLPRKVYDFARGITDVIQDKVPKDYAPAEDREGFVKDLPDRNVLARLIRDDLRHHGAKGGRWMLLFRTNCFIEDMTKTLQQFMVPYHTAKGFCMAARDLAKIERYYRYAAEGYGTPEAREKFMREYKITDFRDGFAASELIPGVERYYYQDLVDTWGLPLLREMSKMDDPFLLLSTVHRVKGGEADYAALFMDCTRLVHENMTLNADEELRVLYVGCTRCREGLYLIPSKSRYSLSRLVDIVREVNDL